MNYIMKETIKRRHPVMGASEKKPIIYTVPPFTVTFDLTLRLALEKLTKLVDISNKPQYNDLAGIARRRNYGECA